MTTYFEEACSVGEALASHSPESWAYFVGGCVRDEILGRTPKDYDIVTNVRPEIVQTMFPKTHPVGAKFGIIMVETESGNLVEVATARNDGAYSDNRRPDEVIYTDDIKEDLARRDFTINAIANAAEWGNLRAQDYIDPFGGYNDAEGRLIRCVGVPDDRFREDALRMMRAVRFAAQLGFDIEGDTAKAIEKNKHLIKNIAIERIREELFKILTSPHPERGMNLLLHLGLMTEITPWFSWVPWRTERLLRFMPRNPSPTLGLSLLIFWIQDSIRQEGILRMLKLSNEQVEQCNANLQSQQLRGAHHNWDRATLIRRARKSTFAEELLCFKAVSHELERLAEYEKLQPRLKALPENLFPALLLTGDDLIAMGYTPGPKFKDVLYLLETEQLNENITTRDQAEKLVKEYMQ